MSGKPYSIGEFKVIVDYLVENKLYGETKARKMWIDFANTKLTTRTWQSLKETFLKRILPDIHNPYFKLTNEQISSFKARRDLADKTGNKLEIHTISDDSNSNGNNQNNIEPSNEEGKATAGENIKCSKPVRSRSSADTVILENCYETAEEIQRDLESNNTDVRPIEQQAKKNPKSLRDCITYSEPLTPMLQEVLDDFASEPEDSDREGQMQIVESVPEKNSEYVQVFQEITEASPVINKTESVDADVSKNPNEASEVVEEVLAQKSDGGSEIENIPPKGKSVTVEKEQLPVVNSDDEISSMQVDIGTEKVNSEEELLEATKVSTTESTEDLLAEGSKNSEDIVANNSHIEPQVHSGNLNHSNSTVDASLPNNPEALKNKDTKNIESQNKETPNHIKEVPNKSSQSPLKASRKRSHSEDKSVPTTTDNKKKKLAIKLKKKSETSFADNQSRTELNKKAIKPDINKKASVRGNSCEPGPSTRVDVPVVDINITEERDDSKETPDINPCLQNVSLFDEQFNKTKYNMSESSDTEQNKKETQKDKQEATVSEHEPANDIVVLKSRSESDSSKIVIPPRRRRQSTILRDRNRGAVMNMFGLQNVDEVRPQLDGLSGRRRRTISNNNNGHHNAVYVSNSSSWSSESDVDNMYVSPPRSRRNRPTRTYLKPKAHRISALSEEGGLFVSYGKKIYPVVKDGKIVKSYVKYFEESDQDGEYYWKLKYMEEKKKAEGLQKQLEETKQAQQREVKSPILQANSDRRDSRLPSVQHASESKNSVGKEICLHSDCQKKEEVKMNPPEKITIKFTKNNEELHLEGHWPQIHPVLEQVVQIFHKEVEQASELPQPVHSKAPSSGISTPIIITPLDTDVHEKVNKIEHEIFQEIEERDKEEEIKPNGEVSNVTNRKGGRPRKSSTTSSEKKSKTSNGAETLEPVENTRPRSQKAKKLVKKAIENQENVSKKTQTPGKKLNETVNMYGQLSMQTRQSKHKLDTSSNIEEKEERYMLPKGSKRLSLRSPSNRKIQKPQKSSDKCLKILPPNNFSVNSIDSTQGYQDSDTSPVKVQLRKKKKVDVSSFVIRTRNSLRRNTRRRSYPYLHCNAYNDSSNSSFDSSVKVVARENSSLNTEVYRTDSYQLLNPQAKVVLRQLEPIDETTPVSNETYLVKNFMCRDETSVQIMSGQFSQMTSDIGSSSNISLPMSPEISVVENLSISKEMLNPIEKFPTMNEIQMDETKEPTLCSKYNMISDIDVSVPLMNQDSEFQNCNTLVEVSANPQELVTESLLKKIDTFTINDQVTPTDTLDKKLHDLILESAKKTSKPRNVQNKESIMEVDVTDVEVKKKDKAKKRCSTPQKRKTSKKSVAPKVDPVIEEQVEYCSHSGRQSCPPLFHTHISNDKTMNVEMGNDNLTIANEKTNGRKKKDIIKVKIQRPKNKLRTMSAQNASTISVFTDSGINDTESEAYLPVNDSVDLIHNHSETCLHANECVCDSIEFVENSKSVITLGDSMQSGDNAWNSHSENNDEHSITPDLFCNNAQDVVFYNKADTDNVDSASDTVYHSPLGTEASPNSLITEDLSDDDAAPATRPTKWYLLSDDETNNTNIVGQGSTMLNSGGFGSNLKQLFPVTCAVPDLSTITEMSKDNDNSRKTTIEDLDGLTGEDFNSLSVFDSNF